MIGSEKSRQNDDKNRYDDHQGNLWTFFMLYYSTSFFKSKADFIIHLSASKGLRYKIITINSLDKAHPKRFSYSFLGQLHPRWRSIEPWNPDPALSAPAAR